FLKGALMADEHKILVSPGENSQAVRMIKIQNHQDLLAIAHLIPAYIQEAILLEKEGKKLEPKKNDAQKPCDELLQCFKEQPELEKAFFALTPGRQRAYHIYFDSAKQSATRMNRILKFIPHIHSGKGPQER
ncbi:MAG: YdeI/OmpD-associated family protein, partial [Bacteroidota bacterium]|nr:YdeI/OmpD-associated family protein [Bacteroidota bacterium]MDX5430719.1 YdeI/OmpD-associated family protein [Bacteroidota bacterium]MDX5469466.1 YdeI/OmpD-associated family protein [Bacteroidota bacterium]